MKRLGWRAGIAAALIVIAFVYLAPSITPQLPDWWSGFLPKDKIHLGLDLQGGVHLVLEVEVQKAAESYLERVVEDLKPDLRKSKIRVLDMKRRGIDGIDLTLAPDQDAKDLETLVSTTFPSFKLQPGVRDANGKNYFLALTEQERTQIYKMAAEQALETIRNRVDQFGVTEPDIRPQAGYGILIQLPGVKDPKRAIDLIGKTAQLEFKLVDEENNLEDALKGNVPPGDEILYESSVDRKTGRKTSIPYLLKKRSPLTGASITDARVQIDQMGEPYVSLSFDSRGARVFERITGDNVGKRLAIVLDNKVYSAPVIRDRISGGRAQITGAFSMDDAKDLAIVLRAGALPAPVKILEERTVGPSLGQDSINQGLKAALVGGLAVIVFMALYYGLAGVIADLAVILNVFFIMAGLAALSATLTLPGIAGIILTIGMAVDANVLIFERIREELRLGKKMAAIDAGFSRAMVTIIDSNLTTLITALVLFQFGTGPVKGFAITLTIGLIANFYTGVLLTRIIFDYLYVQKRWPRISIGLRVQS
jgi:preprotein translocase subunit SecD